MSAPLVPATRSAAARSLWAFGAYLLVAGALLIVAPALLLAPLGIAAPQDVWVRLAGLLAMCLGAGDVMVARHALLPMIQLSVWRRGLAAAVIVAFVVTALAPPALGLFALVDAAAALWTALALRRAAWLTVHRGVIGGVHQACVMFAMAAIGAAVALPNPAAAAPVVFSATMAGASDIVDVVDPNVPIVRVQTSASGAGVLGINAYRSGDIVNLATGAGSGANVFETAQGDELFASFDVQLVPTLDPSVFSLFASLVFGGGSGIFSGATGTGSFTGSVLFTSPTHAQTRFSFEGELLLVPLPGTAPLALAALALMGAAPLSRSTRLRAG